MDKVIYQCTGKPSDTDQLRHTRSKETVAAFDSRRRNSDERRAKALAVLRAEYAIKARAVGMTLDGYCSRFNVRLPCLNN